MKRNKPQRQSEHVPLKSILQSYWQAAKQFPVSMIGTLLLYAGGIILSDIVVKLYYRDLFDILAGSEDRTGVWPEIWQIFVIIIVVTLIFNILYRAADFFIVHAQTNVMRVLTNYTFRQLQKHSYSFFTGSFAGSLVAKVRRYTRAFEVLHDKITFEFWFAGIQLIGVFWVLLIDMPSLAYFFAAWCIAFITISIGFARFRMRFDLRAAETDSAVTGQLADVLGNILNVKMFATGQRESQRFSDYTDTEFRTRRLAWNVGNIFHTFQGLSMAVLEIVGMYMTLRLWAAGDISTGTVILVQSYFAMIMGRLWGIGRAVSDTFKAFSDASEMVAILRQPLEVKDPSPPEPCHIQDGAIEFANITFRYQGGKEVFGNFALDIPAGQRLGIVGHSGAGKSTLFKLLLRFLDVQNGDIRIDGQSIRSITQDDLHRKISYVPQDPVLFHRSLYENIAYAKPEASQADIFTAAKRAHAHDFISQLPEQYDTFVGERGVKLSGGERQRVALARAILKDAPILLLDEATSSLDSLSEQYIQEQLTTLMQGRTTLAIAHRISTITQMDRIIVMDKNGIAEQGTHQELLHKKGLYADLWDHQSNGFLPDDTDETIE